MELYQKMRIYKLAIHHYYNLGSSFDEYLDFICSPEDFKGGKKDDKYILGRKVVSSMVSSYWKKFKPSELIISSGADTGIEVFLNVYDNFGGKFYIKLSANSIDDIESKFYEIKKTYSNFMFKFDNVRGNVRYSHGGWDLLSKLDLDRLNKIFAPMIGVKSLNYYLDKLFVYSFKLRKDLSSFFERFSFEYCLVNKIFFILVLMLVIINWEKASIFIRMFDFVLLFSILYSHEKRYHAERMRKMFDDLKKL